MPELNVFAAGTETAGKICSICQTAIIAGEHIVYCPDCSLPFHEECWNENRGCSAYGCKSAPPTIKADSSPEAISRTWGGEKPCPACGRTIKGEALKCRFCGATFETRDLISATEYAQREYEGADYVKARNKVIAMFLAAVFPCLTPFTLIALAFLIFNGSVFGLDYRRLHGSLRGMALAAFGIGCCLVLLLVLFLMFD